MSLWQLCHGCRLKDVSERTESVEFSGRSSGGEKKQKEEEEGVFTEGVKKARRHCGAVVRQHLQSPHSEKVVAGFSGPGAFLHVPRSPSLPGFSAASPASSQRPKTCTLGLIGCQSTVHRCNCDAHLSHYVGPAVNW